MAKIAVAYVGNTNVLTLTGLKSDDEGIYLNDATVTLTVKDTDGAAVAGESWPVTMDYVASSNGNYRAVISAEAEFVAKAKYTAVIDVDASDVNGERIGHWEFPFQAQVRAE